MSFNLNTSRKPEYTLNENLTDETINMYGISCKWLYSEKVNVDFVFNDFSHMKVGTDFKDITLLPEDSSNWEGDVAYNSFGFFNQWTQHLYISKAGMLSIYPDFLTNSNARSKVVNSLIITPSSTLLEITHVESFAEGINNLWGYADDPSSYKLTVKAYSNNLSDEGTNIKTEIKFGEGQDGEIFNHTENIDTTDIDQFFESLETTKTKQDTEADKISNSGGPFGSLG